MKKYNKLFAILFAVLGVQTLSAQTDVTSTYLTNADFSSTDGWTAYVSGNYRDYGNLQIGGQLASYTASTSDETHLNTEYCLGFQCRWNGNYSSYNQETAELPAGVYTLSYDVENVNGGTTSATYNNLFYVKVGDKTLTDTSVEWMNGRSGWTSHSISFVITAATKVTVSLGYGTGSNNFETKYTPVLYVSHLKLTHKPFADVTEENPADLTSMASNTKEAWTGATETPGYDGITMVAVYKSSDWTGDALSQTINGLPAGNYRMEVYCQAHSSWDTDAAEEGATGYTYLCANEYRLDVPIRNADGATTKELYTFDEISVTDGTLKISVVNEQLAANWLSVYVKSLTYFGPDKSLEEANFATNIAALNALSTNDLPTAFVTKINDLKSTYGSADAASMTLSELIAANGDIKAVVDLHPSMVAAYAKLDTYVSTHDNSVEIESGAKATFKAAIDKAVTDADDAVTVEEINNAIIVLEAARQTYVQKADPTNDTYFDYTFLVTNPGFDNAKEGWTSTGGAQNKQIATNKTNGIITGNFYENWNGNAFTGEIYQTVSNLPNGIYKLKIAAFGAGANVYANDLQTEVTTGEGAWYEVDQVTVGNGTLKFGIKNENSATWMGIDNASLYYYGFDVETAQNSVTTLKAEAEALVGKLMNAEIATALAKAIAGADDSKSTRNELEPMIADLSTAIDNAEASIAAYETIATYIAKANNIDESIAAEYQTAYDDRTLESAETVFQELEVATYDYVKDKFSYPVELPEGNWVAEGPTGSKSEQHWSGEQRSYLEQSDAAWGANAWSISYKQDKTLPAGDYVFKVSGRRAAGTGNTLSLVVTNINDPENPVELGVVNDFPEGDTGLGINKNGETSFDAEDEAGFANNNNGRGWQWRYVKFTLTNETKVQVAVEAEATTNHQWISFCDATLQMTEETYLEANMGALDAPTAAAEALVDTKPMGTEENTALKEALAMPVNTGAELLAKIEALETAVANANAWVAAYNEAKAPLVAALERFETDYNDGASGCLYHLQKDAWNTVILEVEDAVTAKDVTDSYDGFDDATTELVAALDAAQASIDMYAKLKAEIAYAQAYTPLIEGNAAGHTAAITAAQNAYDAAEIADASELILAMQNYKVLDYQYVVANYDKEFELGDWTGQTHTNNGEHWNGQDGATYFDYSKWSDGYKNGANEATQSVTLPAGDYVLMAAGRAASVDGTEAYIKVNETKVNYDARGGVGRGIDTDGTASFAENGTYANKDGRGWEYRFIEFTLTKTTEVTLTAGMVIDKDASSLSWAGVCTPVLFTRALDVTLEISDANWATLILPFDATLPEGVKAYSCGETEGENLTLVETESIEANTPYLVSGKKGSYNFSGYSLAEKDSYTVGLFTGTYVDYQTTAGSNTYVLQNGAEGVAFYLVGEDAQPKVKAYRCYMTYGAATGAPVFRIGKGTTGIDNAQLTNDNVVIYDLMGRKVNTMVKGGMYIVNGKKVVIR